jgi:signal peptidase I
MTDRHRPAGDRRPRGVLRETVESLGSAIVIFLVIRLFAFHAFRIPSESMENTLLVGDFLFVNKLAYGPRIPFTTTRLPGFTHPKPGDVIVFEYPRDRKVAYIKRCVAMEGQTVEVRNKQLFVDGIPRDDAWAVHKDARFDPMRDNFGPYKVPPGFLFMMGDNRDFSADSRVWGPLDKRFIHGKAWVIYFSWDRFRHFPRFPRMFHLIH